MCYMDNQPPKKIGLLELLKQSVGAQFVIPVYQRNYTWTTGREVKRFLDDLNNVLVGTYKKHFLGIMIYLDTNIDFATREFSIIDGQQRLTTTFLTLYAIKELMLEKKMENEVRKLDGQYFYVNNWDDTVKYKLKPQVSDDEVYQQIVMGNFKKIQQKSSNVYKNFDYIKDYITKLSKKYSINDILMALDKLYIVCVPVTIDDYPQRIFESINATGAKLTASDLIRNYILMPIESKKQEEYYNTYWKKIEEFISTDSKKLEGFFRLYLAAKNKSLPNKNAVYSVFVEWYESYVASFGIDGVFKDIVKYAEYYNIIYIRDLNMLNPAIRSSIRELRQNPSDMPAPLFMELYNLTQKELPNGEKCISFEQFNEIINLTNIYLMRRALCSLDTSDITRMFPALLKDILNEVSNDFSNIVDVFKGNLINKNKGNSMEMPDDIKLYDSIINANMYNIRSSVRVFFDKLETNENPAPVDLSKLSIEHLMPQTPTPEWYKELNIDEAEYQRNLHRLGNLTLATKHDNSKMKNKMWEYKNEILSSTAHLKMNIDLLKKEQWQIKDIDERTKDLISKINKLYPYFELAGEHVKKISIYIESKNIIAKGKLCEDNGSVEIEAGSLLNTSFKNASNYPEIDDMRQELIEEGVIKNTEKGLMFIKDYTFYAKSSNGTALSTTASLILHGSRNGWEKWKTDDGKQLTENETLKNKFSN